MAGDVEEALAVACADLARTMARPDAADTVLPRIAAHVVTVLAVGTAGVLLEDSDGRIVVASASDELIATLLGIEQDVGDGPTIVAFAEDTTARADTLVDVGRAWPRWVPEARALGVGAWLSVPSGTEDATVVVSAASTRPRHWQDVEMRAAQVLADLAAGWVAHADELDRARRTAEQLQDALDHRMVIEQAKGILAGELGCSLDQAFAMLRAHARRNSVTVRSVAQAVVELGLRPPAPQSPEGVT